MSPFFPIKDSPADITAPLRSTCVSCGRRESATRSPSGPTPRQPPEPRDSRSSRGAAEASAASPASLRLPTPARS